LLEDRAAHIEAEIAPRRLPASLGSDKTVVSTLATLNGVVIRVDSYEHDLEAWALGKQMIDLLDATHVTVRNALLTTPAIGNIDVGVHVTASDAKIGSALLIILKIAKIGGAINHPPPNPTLRMVDTPPYPVATVFVGVKPLNP
jgi:hypothetical protein